MVLSERLAEPNFFKALQKLFFEVLFLGKCKRTFEDYFLFSWNIIGFKNYKLA
jgi:hypothetical protein